MLQAANSLGSYPTFLALVRSTKHGLRSLPSLFFVARFVMREAVRHSLSSAFLSHTSFARTDPLLEPQSHHRAVHESSFHPFIARTCYMFGFRVRTLTFAHSIPLHLDSCSTCRRMSRPLSPSCSNILPQICFQRSRFHLRTH